MKYALTAPGMILLAFRLLLIINGRDALLSTDAILNTCNTHPDNRKSFFR